MSLMYTHHPQCWHWENGRISCSPWTWGKRVWSLLHWGWTKPIPTLQYRNVAQGAEWVGRKESLHRPLATVRSESFVRLFLHRQTWPHRHTHFISSCVPRASNRIMCLRSVLLVTELSCCSGSLMMGQESLRGIWIVEDFDFTRIIRLQDIHH